MVYDKFSARLAYCYCGDSLSGTSSRLGTNIREETLNSDDKQLSLALLGCLEFSYKGHAMFSIQKIIL